MKTGLVMRYLSIPVMFLTILTAIEVFPETIRNNQGAIIESGLIEKVSVPFGKFVMGLPESEDDDGGEDNDALPRHNVTLYPYYIGTYEITNGQYCTILNWALDNGYLESYDGGIYTGGNVYKKGKILIEITSSQCQIRYLGGSFDWKSRDGYSMESHPVVEVSWYGAVAFCNWLSEREGLIAAYDLSTWALVNKDDGGYRLPTEAEWERACAWDGSKHWNYGFLSDTLTGKDRCNYYDSNPEYVNPLDLSSYPYTSPVGWFDGIHISPNGDIQTIDSRSPIGAYDMTGNVSEWCHDWYSSTYYSGGDMANPVGPSGATHRVLRGGDWTTVSGCCRSALRYARLPTQTIGLVGFRVVQINIPPTPTPQPLVDYTFETLDEGWVFQGEILPYDIPASEATDGHLGITASGSANAFSYWHSPDIEIGNSGLYKVTWIVGSSATSADIAPQFRLRVDQKDAWQSWNRVVTSNFEQAPCDGSDKSYEVFMNPRIASADDALFILSFDLLSFDEMDDTGSWLYLESVMVQEELYSEEIEVERYTFDESEDGWSCAGKIGSYDEPLSSGEGWHLGLSADGSINCYSYWFSPDVSISDTGYYRAWFEVGSSSSDHDITVQFRLRATQKGSWQSWERVVKSSNQQAPALGDKKTYDLLLNPTITGADDDEFIFSFDIMSFDWSDDIFSWLYLETCKISKIAPITMEMVTVPAGKFVMGRTDYGDDGTFGESDELPRHDVTLSAYKIWKYEVTNGQYCDVLNWALQKGYLENAEGSTYSGGDVYKDGEELIEISSVYCQIQYSGDKFTCERRNTYSMDRHPVVMITWYGAVAFCNWLSEMSGLLPAYELTTWELVNKDGGGYRLPTEAEWERAAAWDGAKHWIYGFTSDTLTGKNRCNYYDFNPRYVNPLEWAMYPYTSPVGWFDGVHVSPNGNIQTIDSPSPIGAYDMSGNLFEWCHDWYGDRYYSGGAMTDPIGPSSGTYRIVRGGDWYTLAKYCRSAYRDGCVPTMAWPETGMRVVQTILTISTTTPIPTPPVHYTFDTSDEGWLFEGEIPPFDVPASESADGHLGITASGSANAFSYWHSPDIGIQNGRLYKVTWDVGSSATSPDIAPQFRLRVDQKGAWQSWDRVVTSNLEQAPWAEADKTYTVFLNPHITSDEDALVSLSFDLLSFDEMDDSSSWLYLESVVVEQDEYIEGSEIACYTFESSVEGWSWQGKILPYDEAHSSSDDGHLGIGAGGSANCYSYWLSPAVTITESGYYRARFEVSSSSTNPDTSLQFRVRTTQEGSWQGWERIVKSVHQQAPSSSCTKKYDVIFDPGITGAADEQFMFSFDILSFDWSDDLYSWLYLESCKISEVLCDSEPTSMVMVSIPEGRFEMGRRDDGDDGMYGESDEIPRHDVTLSAYDIWKYEVTNGQYCIILNWAQSKGYLENESGGAYAGGDIYINRKLLLAISSWSQYCQIQYSGGSFSVKTRDGYSMQYHPVVMISWYGAVAFCNWLSEKEGLIAAYDLSTWALVNKDDGGYRLPTEAEWERVAAWDGTTHWIYGFVSDTLIGRNRCNYQDKYPLFYVNPLGLSSNPLTAPVGWFDGVHISPNGNIQTIDSPSPVGTYDMSGNVNEWCHDWYSERYYSEGAMTNPDGPTSGIYRVVRGGHWGDCWWGCRTAGRWATPPDYTTFTTSFRVVRTP